MIVSLFHLLNFLFCFMPNVVKSFFSLHWSLTQCMQLHLHGCIRLNHLARPYVCLYMQYFAYLWTKQSPIYLVLIALDLLLFSLSLFLQYFVSLLHLICHLNLSLNLSLFLSLSLMLQYSLVIFRICFINFCYCSTKSYSFYFWSLRLKVLEWTWCPLLFLIS